ncbi:DUF3889 domain-containing protein [Paenibacillus methanolicus]|uniref:Uncharacterized protein DUF3889 n=1 Tax=Paenibacillus methanolicus TaxID=582686 RepID=A0A5S5CFV5_9BACL|nr:DUF3889 domain-containing protein [Paenibacillus methanolicus]TYP77568.1 uncharacterized protein DUF3889 [Paenibacillus methanolicus]
MKAYRWMILALTGVWLVVGLVHPDEVGAEPSYAKWGRIAVKETIKRYHADVIDYKHVGRQVDSDGLVSETFKLILNKERRQFAVTVQIWFEHQSEQVVRLQFTEEGKSAGGMRKPKYRIV